MRISSNRSWTRPNRRHIHRDLYLPGILKQPDVEMVVAIDTSGSTHEYLGDFLAELHAIFSSFTNYKVTLIQCDTEINKVDEFSTAEGNLFPSGKEQKKFEFKGFGGTDLCPPFDYVKEKSSSDIQCLVYFTDGFGPTPQEAPDYPVIWVLVPDGVKPAKWGEEVYIQKGKKNGKQ
jgi:predicted metal-dependent peptidase